MRCAEFSDIPKMVDLARQFHDEGRSNLPFNPVVFSSTLADYIIKEERCAFVCGQPVHGMLLGVISQYPADNVLQANELLWYCEKDNRGKGALKLFNSYRKWAKSKGAKLIFGGAFEGGASLFYEKIGFSFVDESWVEVV